MRAVITSLGQVVLLFLMVLLRENYINTVVAF